MRKSKEPEIFFSIMQRIKEEFPILIEEAKEEFIEYYGDDILKTGHFGQYFYGWFFSVFTIDDGKNMITLAKQYLRLNDDEKKLLENVQNSIPGYFKILNIKNNDFYLEDILTKKDYWVKTIDLDHNLFAGNIIKADLVKNLDNDFFFFGGFRITNDTRVIELNLAEYSRDLDIEELVEREILILSDMEEELMASYLCEVLELEEEEIDDFILR